MPAVTTEAEEEENIEEGEIEALEEVGATDLTRPRMRRLESSLNSKQSERIRENTIAEEEEVLADAEEEKEVEDIEAIEEAKEVAKEAAEVAEATEETSHLEDEEVMLTFKMALLTTLLARTKLLNEKGTILSYCLP